MQVKQKGGYGGPTQIPIILLKNNIRGFQKFKENKGIINVYKKNKTT